MTDGMFMPPIPRDVIDRRRWIIAAKRAVVPDIRPDMPGDRFTLGQDRHLRVIAMQPFGSQNVGFDQSVERLQHRRTSAHLVGQCRNAEINPFAPISLTLPVQRLMLAELLKQDHRQ